MTCQLLQANVKPLFAGLWAQAPSEVSVVQKIPLCCAISGKVPIHFCILTFLAHCHHPFIFHFRARYCCREVYRDADSNQLPRCLLSISQPKEIPPPLHLPNEGIASIPACTKGLSLAHRFELQSKLLVSPLINPMVIPYTIHYITPF